MSDRLFDADGDRFLLEHDDDSTDLGEFVRVSRGSCHTAAHSGEEYRRRSRRPASDGYDELDFA